MADAAPTYRIEKDEDGTTFTCIVPDVRQPDGFCAWWSHEIDLLTQHMHQWHAGHMIAEPAPKGDRSAQATVRKVEAQVAEKTAPGAVKE